jgi:uncharacterized protein YbjQ (UPF0145 family)
MLLVSLEELKWGELQISEIKGLVYVASAESIDTKASTRVNKAQSNAINNITKQAEDMGANAIIGVKFTISVIPASNINYHEEFDLIIVTVYGTAVKLL